MIRSAAFSSALTSPASPSRAERTTVPLLAEGAVEHGDQARVVLDDENRLLLSRVRHRRPQDPRPKWARASAAATALESVRGARLLWVRDRPVSDAKPSSSPCRCTDDRGGRSRRLGVDRRAHRHGPAARKQPTSLRGHRRDACSYDYFEWDDVARHRRFREPCPAELRVGHRVCGLGHTRLAIGDRRRSQ